MTPDVRVVRGEPEDLELAALVAGLDSGRLNPNRSEAEPARHREAAERGRWRDGAVRLRDPLRPGPDAWRWSATPR